MKKVLTFTLVFVGWLNLKTLGQTTKRDVNLEYFIENLFQVQDLDISYEDLYESLFMLYTEPINLNKTNAEELASLYILAPNQITNFLEYLQTYGKLLSIYELQAVPGFDLETIHNLLPFVTVKEQDLAADSRTLLRRMLEEENNYFFIRYQRILETQRGYTAPTLNASGTPSSRYLGSPNKYMGRFRTSHRNDFSMGFTFEKDAGEAFMWNPEKKTYGVDFWSYHLTLHNKGIFKTIAIGDYQVQMGQGLIFGAGFAPGKGAETVTTVRRGSTGIRPYNSVLESGFFRGVAATADLGAVEVSTYLSRTHQDGSIRSDTAYTDFEEYISAIQQTGFHRTPNELNNKNQVLEQNVGASVVHHSHNKNYQIGASILHTEYSVPLQRRPNNYNQYEFNGSQNTIYGAFGNYIWQNFNLFGEIAQSSSGGIGAIGGLMTSLSKQVDFSFVLRDYQRDFHTFYGNAFSEGARTINEKGMYWGIRVRANRQFFFSAYYDKFRFPWLRFRAEAPSQGYEYLIRANYRPDRNILMYLQMREEGREISTISENPNLKMLSLGRKYNYLFNLDYTVNSVLSLKSRVQYSNYLLEGNFTEGFAIMQDFNLEVGKIRLSSRFALFDTDDFQNRQYVYERDVLYGFSIPAYSGTGTRKYLLLQYKMNRKTSFWIRYARFNFRNSPTIGSGLEQIEGNTRSEIKAQFLIKI